MRMKILFMISSVLLVSGSALAQLGGDESTIENVRLNNHGIHAMRTRNNLRVHEITNEANTIREYVNSDGIVFAVTWSGMSHPDLTVLLGEYHAEFQEADQATRTPAGRAPKTLRTQNLRTIHYGHMRDVHGKAFIQSLAPPGFDPKDLE